MNIALESFNINVLLNSRVDVTCILRDFTRILRFITVREVGSIVQDVQLKRIPVDIAVFFY